MAKYRARREYGQSPVDSYNKTTNDTRYGRPEPPYIPVQHDRPQWQGRPRKIEYDAQHDKKQDEVEQSREEIRKRDEKIAKLESDLDWWDIYWEEFGKHYGKAIQRWNAEQTELAADDDDWIETVDARHQEAQAFKEDQETKANDELEKFAGRNIYEMSLEELRELRSYGHSELVEQRLKELEAKQNSSERNSGAIELEPQTKPVEPTTDIVELVVGLEPEQDELLEPKEKISREDLRESY